MFDDGDHDDSLWRRTICIPLPEKCIFGKCSLWPWPLNPWSWTCHPCHIDPGTDLLLDTVHPIHVVWKHVTLISLPLQMVSFISLCFSIIRTVAHASVPWRVINVLTDWLIEMAECLLRAQPVSVANHVKARQSLIKCAVTWLTTGSAEASLFSGSATPVDAVIRNCD